MLTSTQLRSDHIEYILALHALGLARKSVLDLFESKYGFRVSERTYRAALLSKDKVTPGGIGRVIRFIFERGLTNLRPVSFVLLDNLELIESLVESGCTYRDISSAMSDLVGRPVSEDQVARVFGRAQSVGKPDEYYERMALWHFLVGKSSWGRTC